MGPYSLPSTSQSGAIEYSDTFASWLIQPMQINASGNIPGNTNMTVNGQGVVISGATSSIIINDLTTLTAVISILGADGYILFTNPTSGLNQIIIGNLPDGNFGLVISKPTIDVLDVFS